MDGRRIGRIVNDLSVYMLTTVAASPAWRKGKIGKRRKTIQY